MITPFSVAQAKEIIRSSTTSPRRRSVTTPPDPILSPEEEETSLVCTLVDDCYGNHRRAFFGALPPEQCKLCSYANGEWPGSVSVIARGLHLTGVVLLMQNKIAICEVGQKYKSTFHEILF